MPFLWNVSQKPIKNKSIRPSPKRKTNSFFGGFIKRASLPAFLKKEVRAAMTVEAAIVLPLFLFFFVNLGSAIEMIRMQGNLQLALWEVGNRMCVYGHVSTLEGFEDDGNLGSLLDGMAGVVLSYTYVKDQIVDYIGKEKLEESPIVHGVDGLQFVNSRIGAADSSVVSGDVLDIVLTYEVAPFIEIPYMKPFRMSNRYYGRLWTGFDIANRQDVVYIAENASVYHETWECTHLKLSVRQVSLEEALELRNAYGRKYTECAKCWDGKSVKSVYIAKEGDSYHKERHCPGLKRTIFTITREAAEAKYKPCSRCGGQ